MYGKTGCGKSTQPAASAGPGASPGVGPRRAGPPPAETFGLAACQSYMSKGLWRQGIGSFVRNSEFLCQLYALSSYALTCTLLEPGPDALRSRTRRQRRVTRGGLSPRRPKCVRSRYQIEGESVAKLSASEISVRGNLSFVTWLSEVHK